MAFVSDEYELVFLHSTKTAGTSITSALCDIHGETMSGESPLRIPERFRPNT